MVALLPMPALAEESGGGDELDIPEIVLEHLADAYEWHIASYEGKHLSIPLPIIIRSENTGEWHFCTAHSLPEGFFFSEEHHGKIYERMADGTEARPRCERRGSWRFCRNDGDDRDDDSRRPDQVVDW